ncbi:MAG TPA: cyclase family protein [Pseudonocardiaceae bacterium]|nr:cyclase family protein [Pseudonocardiaceae bacterium]
MSLVAQLNSAIGAGSVRIVDLTAPLNSSTPILQLPAPFGNTINFQLEEISRYDERGPRWYWNNIHTGEHTGTHLDAPKHWLSGKDGHDVAQVPLRTLIAPAVVLDMSARVADNPDYLLEIEEVQAWQAEHGPLPDGGWLLYRTGWDARSGDQADFLNADDKGSHTPGVSAACARWLADESPIAGLGVETVGTDAGRGPELDPMFPCHELILGAGKYGLTQLQNLASLPPTGVLLVVCPLPITGGSGSPARVLALVERGQP